MGWFSAIIHVGFKLYRSWITDVHYVECLKMSGG